MADDKHAADSMKVYLDTNAASYLYRHPLWSGKELRRIRRALADECAAGRMTLIVSDSLAEELAGISTNDMPRYVRTMKFVFDLAGANFLIPHNERIIAEVAAKGSLCGRARFLSGNRRRELRTRIMGNDFVREVADAVYSQVQAYQKDMAARRDTIKGKSPDPSKDTAQWFKDALPQIDDWTRDYMRASRDILGLPKDETQWPLPREVPTAWNIHAYYMARVALNVGQNRKIVGSDQYDHRHYANAAYADLMVTDDGAFRETYNTIPDKPFAITSFEAFAAKLGVTRP